MAILLAVLRGSRAAKRYSPESPRPQQYIINDKDPTTQHSVSYSYLFSTAKSGAKVPATTSILPDMVALDSHYLGH